MTGIWSVYQNMPEEVQDELASIMLQASAAPHSQIQHLH